jgi:two-component system, OmpR family, sensor histidine kinase VicK
MSSKDSIRESAAASMPSSLENHDIKDVSSSHYEEKTEVIYGLENVTNFALQQLSTVNKTLDLCGDRYGPSIIVANEPIMQKYIEIHNRGVRQRHIVEITAENVADCKKLTKFQELRHLDGLKGYLSILDGKVLGAHAYGLEYGLPHAVASTVKVFVEQQQYFFETLWNKAIPARQRIKELEEGAKREFVETIRDPSEIEKVSFDLIKKAEEEILILFSAANAFHQQVKIEALEQLKEAVKLRNIKVRILVPTGDNNNDEEESIIVSKRIEEMKDSGIDIRTIKHNFQNKLTTLIIDQSLCLTVELKDEDNNTRDTTTHEAIGLATYSNSEATVFSYVSIFENLWIQTELQKRQQQQEEETAAN